MSIPKKPAVSKLLSMLNISENEISQMADPQLLTKKMTMLGVVESLTLLVEGIKNTILANGGKVSTNTIRLFLDAMGIYVMMLETELIEYDTKAAALAKAPPSEGVAGISSDKANEFMDLLLKKVGKSGGGGGNDGGPSGDSN